MVVAATLVGANSAFASRGRLEVLGTSNPIGLIDRGSFYVDDNNNIFYNPAQINNFKNWAAVEKNNGGAEAEGGFATQVAGFNLGIYMNRGEYVVAPQSVRPIDIIFGGDMGVKWGVGATIGGSRQGEDAGTSLLDLRVGAEVSGFEPFANFRIMGTTSTVPGDADDVKVGDMGVGFRYKYGEWVPFLAWRQQSLKVGTADSDTTDSVLGLGVGRNSKVAEGVRLNYAVSLQRAMKGSVGTNTNIVPLEVSAEADATSWLVVRAGLGYRLLDRTANVTNNPATTGKFGATINMGKASLDWAIAKGGVNTTTSQSFDFADHFFSVASLNYRW
jgi:hypothetical protein